MGLVQDIGDYLEEQSIGTVGTDIFLSEMPDTPDTCISIYRNEDTAVERIAGIDMPSDRLAGIKRPRFKVAVRASSYDSAMTLAKTIEDELVRIGDEFSETLSAGVEINNTFYFRVDSSEDAFEQERDVQSRVIVAQKFITAARI